MQNNPEIHARLSADCHLLGGFDSCTVLLNRNASLPWFILVPNTEIEDILDLPGHEVAHIVAECRLISRFLKQSLHFPKVNFAGLGNVVPQMHLHVIGRRPGDACWPDPVWGHLQEQQAYSEQTISAWQQILVAEYGLCARE